MAQVTFANITITGGMTFDPVTGYNAVAIFGYGYNGVSTYYSITNLVSNTGVVSADVTGVGTAGLILKFTI